MIIEFDKNVNRRTLHWIVDKIRSKKVEGGSQLLIKKEPTVKYCTIYIDASLTISLNFFSHYHSSHEKGLTLHVSATRLRLLEIADEIGYMKPTKDGMRSFNIGCLDDFIYEGLYTCLDPFSMFSGYFRSSKRF